MKGNISTLDRWKESCGEDINADIHSSGVPCIVYIDDPTRLLRVFLPPLHSEAD